MIYSQKFFLLIGYLKNKFWLSMLIVISIYFLLIWIPVNSFIQSANSNLINIKELQHWINLHYAELIALRHQPIQKHFIPEANLLSTINQQASILPWHSDISEIKESEDHQVEMIFNNVDFDVLIQSIGQLTDEYEIQVEKITIQPMSDSGRVKADLFLASHHK